MQCKPANQFSITSVEGSDFNNILTLRHNRHINNWKLQKHFFLKSIYKQTKLIITFFKEKLKFNDVVLLAAL